MPGKEMKSAFLKILLFSLGLISLYSCRNSSGGDPGRPASEYTWQIDTLSFLGYSQTLMKSIYWLDDDNIYIAGHCSDNNGSIHHYDGKKWNFVPYHENDGGPISGLTLFSSVFGFGPNDIWYAGSEDLERITPLVVHYDGETWKKIPIIGLVTSGLPGKMASSITGTGWISGLSPCRWKIIYQKIRGRKTG